jgi:hypothetical protein
MFIQIKGKGTGEFLADYHEEGLYLQHENEWLYQYSELEEEMIIDITAEAEAYGLHVQLFDDTMNIKYDSKETQYV